MFVVRQDMGQGGLGPVCGPAGAPNWLSVSGRAAMVFGHIATSRWGQEPMCDTRQARIAQLFLLLFFLLLFFSFLLLLLLFGPLIKAVWVF